MTLTEALGKRFGEHRIEVKPNPLHNEQQLVFMYLELNVPVTVISTAKLHEYTMPVSEKWVGREYSEICFCLPAHWDLDDLQNPNFNWVYEWLYQLERFVLDRNTWFGPGHSIPCGNPPSAISPLMKQDHFLFAEPMFLGEELTPLNVDGKTVYFLTILPIFVDELDYKNVKGTYKFIKRFLAKKNDERIDEYRKSIMASRFRMF